MTDYSGQKSPNDVPPRPTEIISQFPKMKFYSVIVAQCFKEVESTNETRLLFLKSAFVFDKK
jgi:hypothetical protein